MDLSLQLVDLEADGHALQPQLTFTFVAATTGRTNYSNVSVDLDGHLDIDGDHWKLPPITPPAGGIGGLTSNDNRFTATLPLTHRVVERIEEVRDGRPLTISLKATVRGENKNGNNQNQGTRGTDTVSRKIYGDEWTTILDELGHHDLRVVDLPLGGGTETRDLLQTAQAQVTRAEQRFDNGDYKSTMTACREAIESLRHVDETALKATVGTQKWERFDAQMGTFETKFLGLLSHSEDKTSSKPPLRRDAEFGIIQTKSFLRYFSVALQEESEASDSPEVPDTGPVNVDLGE